MKIDMRPELKRLRDEVLNIEGIIHDLFYTIGTMETNCKNIVTKIDDLISYNERKIKEGKNE